MKILGMNFPGDKNSQDEYSPGWIFPGMNIPGWIFRGWIFLESNWLISFCVLAEADPKKKKRKKKEEGKYNEKNKNHDGIGKSTALKIQKPNLGNSETSRRH